ncbi:hypothetical protein ACLB1G_25955 [Oxalobacteraceae bacterium A2-2]
MAANIVATEAEYRAALAELGELIVCDPAPGSAEGQRLLALARLVEEYEVRVYPFAAPTAEELAEFLEHERHA